MSVLAEFLENKRDRFMVSAKKMLSTSGIERAALTYLLAADRAHTDAKKGTLNIRHVDIEIGGIGDRIDMKTFRSLAPALALVSNHYTGRWLYTEHTVEERQGKPPVIHAAFARRTGAPLPDWIYSPRRSALTHG